MTPIDLYREHGFFGRRVFELYDDRVVVTGYEAFVSKFKVTVMLETLDPTINQYSAHERIRLLGTLLFVGAAVGALSWSKYPPIYANFGFWILSAFSLIGLWLLLRSLRQIETVVFHTSAGVARLMVGKIGPDVLRFQDFAAKIASQVEICRTAKGGSQGQK